MAAGTLAKTGAAGRAAVPGLFAALMALTSDAVLVFDSLGRVLSANPRAEELSGLTLAELTQTDIRDLIFDASRLDASEDELAPATPLTQAPLPFAADGSTSVLSLRLATGGAARVRVRCDRVSAPGETYLSTLRALDAAYAREREHDRLVDELSLANKRLSGTLRIVLETIDVQDVSILFTEVLEQITDTLDASGTLLYLAGAEGFHLQGATRSLAARTIPQFLAYGEGIETMATRAGASLRLRLMAPGEQSLRSGALRWRELMDEETGVARRIPARQVPPFTSFICVPVWFGGHMIALMQVGWSEARPTRRDDARLLDSVAQYLSVELAAALSSLRAERTQRLDAAASRLREELADAPELATGDLSLADQTLHDELQLTSAPIHTSAHQAGCVVSLPDGTQADLPASLDSLVAGHVDGGVAVLRVEAASELGAWLARQGVAGSALLVDLGVLAGKRHAAFLIREPGADPIDETEADFIQRVAVDVREAVEEGEHRTKDARISQALQSGMKNELQKVDGITGHGLYSSATAAASVGGDFYDLIRLPNRRACVILGDVSGKGVEAASVSAAVKTALGAYAWEGLPPARMVRLLNDFLLGFSRLETFATMFVGVIDLAHGTMTYCSAGHPPALLMRAQTQELETLDEQSGVVGAFKGMGYHDGHVTLAKDDTLLLYTDGVTEARAPSGAFFGEQGLRDAVMDEMGGDYDSLLVRLLSRLDSFTQRQLDDDVAMVSLRFDALG